MDKQEELFRSARMPQFLAACKKTFRKKRRIACLLAVAFAQWLLYRHAVEHVVIHGLTVFGLPLEAPQKIGLASLFFIVDTFLIAALTKPWDASYHAELFASVGLSNQFQQSPVLIGKQRDEQVLIYEYLSPGVPPKAFRERKEEIESAFNMAILGIMEGEQKNRVLLRTLADGSAGLPGHVFWDEAYLPQEDGEIALGFAMAGLKVLDLDQTPHVLVGGQSGSGKTVLLRCALYQLYQNGAIIYLYDAKGLIDFPRYARNRYRCVEEKAALLAVLEETLSEMDRRKTLFREAEAANIAEYNQGKAARDKLKRIVIATDEAAAFLNKKGLKGAEKEEAEAVQKAMETIAQQGRFAGIHLWLATQRPDADIVPPQIRSNFSARICGRASDVLSRVVIESGLASEITPETKGRFVTDTDEFFQAFDFHEPECGPAEQNRRTIKKKWRTGHEKITKQRN